MKVVLKDLPNLPTFDNFLDFAHKWGLPGLKSNHSMNSFALDNFLRLLRLSQVFPNGHSQKYPFQFSVTVLLSHSVYLHGQGKPQERLWDRRLSLVETHRLS